MRVIVNISPYACKCLYFNMSMYVCMHIRTYICMHVCVCVHVCIDKKIRACVFCLFFYLFIVHMYSSKNIDIYDLISCIYYVCRGVHVCV